MCKTPCEVCYDLKYFTEESDTKKLPKKLNLDSFLKILKHYYFNEYALITLPTTT